jgi:hypothetical protein
VKKDKLLPSSRKRPLSPIPEDSDEEGNQEYDSPTEEASDVESEADPFESVWDAESALAFYIKSGVIKPIDTTQDRKDFAPPNKS